jgi:hypothetical protein
VPTAAGASGFDEPASPRETKSDCYAREGPNEAVPITEIPLDGPDLAEAMANLGASRALCGEEPPPEHAPPLHSDLDDWTREGNELDDLDGLSDLTPGQRRCFLILSDPAYATASATSKAQAAGIARSSWFRIIHDPGFQQAAKEAHRRAMRCFMGRAVRALGMNAGNTDPKCAPDRRLFFELAGWGGEEDEGPTGYDAMTDAELVAAFKEAGVEIPEQVASKLKARGAL